MRKAEIARTTSETDICIQLNLDGTGASHIATGIGFFDHMLNHVARHGLLDIELTVSGDLHVDFHHTVEDVGLCFGECLRKSLGDKIGIQRYGFSLLPMDETLAEIALDLSGRPLLIYSNPLSDRSAGVFGLDLVQVFFQGLAQKSGMTLHVRVSGNDPHHIAEAIFKGFGRALRQAVEFDPRDQGIPSTKGVLE